jgi:Tol biopolymer transport system component
MIRGYHLAITRFIESLNLLLLISTGFLFSIRVDSQAETNRTGAAILFVSDNNGQPGVYMMDSDGSNVRRFVESGFETGGVLQEANLSPDGTTLAFTSRKNRESHPTNAIFLLDIASGQITPLSNDYGRDSDFPVWSPDGSHLAYLARGVYGNYGQVYIWDATSGENHLLTTGSLLGNTINDVVAGITGLDWSPDGQRLVLAVQTSPPTGHNMLVVINADGTNPQQVTPNDVNAAIPAWKWQNDVVYFVCGLGDYNEICSLDLQTLAFDFVTIHLHDSVPGDNSTHIKWLNVSSDGQFLLQFVGNRNIYLYKARDQSVTSLTAASTATNGVPHWINPPVGISTPIPTDTAK